MKFDKSMAGYHMLVILSEVDGNFDAAEKKVVEQYIKENHPSLINLEVQNRIIDALPNTTHLYCIWHLAKSLQKSISSVLREEYQGFMNKFWRMQSINSMEQFTAEWESLLLTLPEAAVNYLKTWVTPLRNFANAVRLMLPTGGIQSTQGVEQVFGKLKRFVNKRSQVTQLADELHRFVGRRQKTKAANEVKAVKVNDILDVGFRSFCERLGAFENPFLEIV